MLDAGGSGRITPPRPDPKPEPKAQTPAQQMQQDVKDKLAFQAAMLKAQQEREAAKRKKAAAEAAAETERQRKAAKTAINKSDKAQAGFANNWAERNQGRFTSRTELNAQFKTDLEKNKTVQNALGAAGNALTGYDGAVKNELRLAAEQAGSDPAAQKKAIEAKAREIRAREKDGSRADQILDDVVDRNDKVDGKLRKTEKGKFFPDAKEVVMGQSVKSRTASMAQYASDKAQADLKTALAKYQNVGKEIENRDKGHETGPVRQDTDAAIKAGRLADLKAAAKRAQAAAKVANQTNAAFTDEVNTKLGTKLAKIVLADEKTRPNVSPANGGGGLGIAQAQYDGIVKNGNLDLKHYTPEQVNEAVEALTAEVPEAAPMIKNLLGESLKFKLKVNLQLPLINPNDKTLPPWQQKLAKGNDAEKLTLATLKAAGVTTQPEGKVETILAQRDPTLFAKLKMVGGTIPTPASSTPEGMKFNSNFNAMTDKGKLEYARQQFERAFAAGLERAGSSKLPVFSNDPEKYLKQQQKLDEQRTRLQGRLLGSDAARADNAALSVNQLVGDETPEGAARTISDGKPGDSGAKKAWDLIAAHQKSSFFTASHEQIWEQAGAPHFGPAYFEKQARFLETGNGKGDVNAAQVGDWLRAGKGAPEQVKSAMTDAFLKSFSNQFAQQNGQGNVLAGLSELAKGSPERANKIVEWWTAFTDERLNGVAVPALSQTIADGHGTTLANAFYNKVKTDKHPLTESVRNDIRFGREKLQENNAEVAAKAEVEAFNKEKDKILTSVYDDLLKNNPVYLTEHALPEDDIARQTLIGDGLNLKPDVPKAATGQEKYVMRNANGHLTPKGEQIQQAETWIRKVGGENAKIKFLPSLYVSEQGGGIRPIVLMEVTNKNDINLKDGQDTDIIDTSVLGGAILGNNAPWRYGDFKNYQEDNRLNDGRLYFAGSSTRPDLLTDDDHDGHVDNVNRKGVEAAITTTGEKWRRVGDIGLGILGAAGGIALMVGTGGLAAPLVVAAAAGYGAIRSMETLDKMSEHGQSVNPINTNADGAWFGVIDPEAGGAWLGLGASATGLAALRPLALAGSLRQLGSTTLRGFGSELFRNGSLTGLYRSSLAGLPRGIGWSAAGMGGALMTGQGLSLAQAIGNGDIDLSDWGLNSASWDLALFGTGLGTMGAGRAMMASRKAGMSGNPADGGDPPTAMTGRQNIVISEQQMAEMQMPAHLRTQLPRLRGVAEEIANRPLPPTLSAAGYTGGGRATPRTVDELRVEALRLDTEAGRSIGAQKADFQRRADLARAQANALTARAQTIGVHVADQSVGKLSPVKLSTSARDRARKEVQDAIVAVTEAAVKKALDDSAAALAPGTKADSARNARKAGREMARSADRFVEPAVQHALNTLPPQLRQNLAGHETLATTIAQQAVRSILDGRRARSVFRRTAELGRKPDMRYVPAYETLSGNAGKRAGRITGKTFKQALAPALGKDDNLLQVLVAARSGAVGEMRRALAPVAEQAALTADPSDFVKTVFDDLAREVPGLRGKDEQGAREAVYGQLKDALFEKAEKIATDRADGQTVSRRWSRGLAKGVSDDVKNTISKPLAELSRRIAEELADGAVTEKDGVRVSQAADSAIAFLSQNKTPEEKAMLTTLRPTAITMAHVARRTQLKAGTSAPEQTAVLTDRILKEATKVSVKSNVTREEIRIAAQQAVEQALGTPDALIGKLPDTRGAAKAGALPVMTKAVMAEAENQAFLPQVGGWRQAVFRGSARRPVEPDQTRVQKWLPDLRLGLQFRARLRTNLATDEISEHTNRDPNSTRDDELVGTGAPTMASINGAIGTKTKFGVLFQGLGHKFGIYEGVQVLPHGPTLVDPKDPAKTVAFAWPSLKEARHRQLVQSTREKEYNNVNMRELGLSPTSNVTALQSKGSQFIKIAKDVFFGAGDDLFTVAPRRAWNRGEAVKHPGKEVIELDFSFRLKKSLPTKNPDKTSNVASEDFFGAKTNGDGYILPGDLSFGKLMEEFKLSLRPAFWNNLFEQVFPKEYAEFFSKLDPFDWVRLGYERRPESTGGFVVPKGATLSKQAHDQIEAMFGQVRLRMQLVAEPADADVQTFVERPTLQGLQKLVRDGKIMDPNDDANIRMFVPRGFSGLRKSAIITKTPENTFEDLAGQTRKAWDPAQSNLDVIFNDYYAIGGATFGNPDRTFNRALSWPVRRGADRAVEAPAEGLRNRRPGWMNLRTPQPKYLPTEKNILRNMTGEGASLISTATRHTASVSTPALNLADIPGLDRAGTLFGILDKIPVAASAEIRGQLKTNAPKQPAAIAQNTWVNRLGEDNGVITTLTVPRWMEVAISASGEGGYSVVPKGGTAMLKSFVDGLKEGATPKQKAEIQGFERDILPRFKDSIYLPAGTYEALSKFLAAQGRPIVDLPPHLQNALEQWYLDQEVVAPPPSSAGTP